MKVEAVDEFIKNDMVNDVVVIMLTGSKEPLIVKSPKLSHKFNTISGIGADRPVKVELKYIALLTTAKEGEF